VTASAVQVEVNDQAKDQVNDQAKDQVNDQVKDQVKDQKIRKKEGD
jgi:hypothetical protein